MRITALSCLFMLALAVRPAGAETATIATTAEGTPLFYISLALTKTADEIAGMDLRPKPFKSSGQGAVFVDKGEVDFGLHNAIILREAYLGLEFYEGRPLENLRAVARLIPFQVTLSVAGDTDIDEIADMKGKRFPAGFDSTAFGERLYDALLGTAGLSYADVEQVQVSDWAALGKEFIRGNLDVGGMVVGSGSAARYEQLMDNYRGISLPDGPGVEERLKELFPSSRLAVVEPAEGLAGVKEPLTVLEYDYWVFAHKDTSDAAVTELLTSLYDGKDQLIGISPDFRDFDPAVMGEDVGVPFHPAAEAFYASHGG
ncbi:TAXI family TRAP transporter solute-binding subunit [Algicella marina]|uniref:TAXI family TRAP transporter solute-binding subunit n=1 Tax=Algicella marina TaxID=2683284 RepID=A0A6P1T473_9RHOB|nr:TAXI family TRAP transporter solute-binding subunit [Algicella marina]QHQ36059.1 TAXI family TRAP transporter solute-binding subunit [Algicella marina]